MACVRVWTLERVSWTNTSKETATDEFTYTWIFCSVYRGKSRSVDHGFTSPFDLDSLRSKVEGRFESIDRLSKGKRLISIYLDDIIKLFYTLGYYWQRRMNVGVRRKACTFWWNSQYYGRRSWDIFMSAE